MSSDIEFAWAEGVRRHVHVYSTVMTASGQTLYVEEIQDANSRGYWFVGHDVATEKPLSVHGDQIVGVV